MSSVSGPREKGNVEHFVLVYLNNSSIEQSDLIQLRSRVNLVKIFDDEDDSIAFINSIANEKVIVITSNSFAQSILTKIEDLQQLFYIYILSDCSLDNLQSTKIRGSYSTIDDICEQLSEDIQLVSRDLVSYIHICSNGNNSAEAMFIYSVLINEILLDDDESDSAMKELIHFSRHEYQDNQEELTIIDEFESDYQSNRAIWWFSRPSFLSKVISNFFILQRQKRNALNRC